MTETIFPAPDIHRTFVPDAEVVLHRGEADEFLKSLPDATFRLIVTSPPYNLGKEYETRDSIERYLERQHEVIRELVRVMSGDGSICWQVGNFVQRGEVFPLDVFYYPLFKQLGLRLRNRIVWHFEHGLHASNRFSGRYETILWFTKSDEYVFNLDDVRVPSRYPGKTHFKGPNRGKPSGNPLGKNPGDKWAVVARDWDREVWEIPNVKANHPEKTTHPCQFPVELVERCVLALTDPGDWVLDPFAGVGSSLIAALKHSRRAAGIERESRYIKIARQRITSFSAGTLRVRPLGREIHRPTGREKVARRPEANDRGT